MGPDPDDPRRYWGDLLIRLIIMYFWKQAEIRTEGLKFRALTGGDEVKGGAMPIPCLFLE